MRAHHVFLLSFCLIALGYILKRVKVLREEDGKTLSLVIFNVTMPAVILKTVSAVTLTPTLGFLTGFALIYASALGLFSLVLLRKYHARTRGHLSMCASGFNVALFGYPLIEGIWGAAGLAHAAMFDLGNAFAVFVTAYLIGAVHADGGKRGISPGVIIRALLSSAPFITYIVSIALNLSGIRLPAPVIDFISVPAQANAALVLLTLGLYLDFSFDRSRLKSVLYIIAVRYGFGLAAGLLLFFLLPFPLLARTILLVCVLLPMAMAFLPMSVKLDYDARITGMAANVSMLMSFILIWVLVTVLHLA
ncbi:MAG: AEC family transporter [Spirochaetes bacterium]|nr:AEC family transporter [Spirochaetota bacterium]